ncbi:YkgJ family cysteine cluster protein [Bdellovibrio bacteriovorus]|uniref:YkgJ family cysteine cluster protein n=1 Tax=Bdellovibrio bacteriovorus TaxID=959 RepID=UPI0035A5C60E
MEEFKFTGKEWWREGVRFECTGSGKCCTSHGEYGFVYLSLEDRQRFAKHLKMRTGDFTRKYCEMTGGIWHLKEDPKNPDCMFLKGKGCSVYEARPTQCRTWPFWPEVMNAKSWAKDVKAFCPGVGKGPVIPAERIEQQIREQIESEQGWGK